MGFFAQMIDHPLKHGTYCQPIFNLPFLQPPFLKVIILAVLKLCKISNTDRRLILSSWFWLFVCSIFSDMSLIIRGMCVKRSCG